jgi:hypothetical protein
MTPVMIGDRFVFLDMFRRYPVRQQISPDRKIAPAVGKDTLRFVDLRQKFLDLLLLSKERNVDDHHIGIGHSNGRRDAIF